MISMAFKLPSYYEHQQKMGESYALFGATPSETNDSLNETESSLFMANRVVVRSKLNAALLAQLGHPQEKMVLLPHAPVWSLRNNNIFPAELCRLYNRPSKQHKKGFDLLFMGEKFLKKGLFRLYRAFSLLDIPGKRLHLYNRSLYEIAQGTALNLPSSMLPELRQMIADPAVIIHPPYQAVGELIQAHAQADLLVCPSLSDLGPNVLIEGYQLGTPILASTLCGAVFDLPKDAVHQVEAPHWWQQQESPDSFTERLAEQIIRFHREYKINVQPSRPELMPLIKTIINTWEDLLNEYL
jgi:glycosyltransferase involved in cell wall biosynthesis